MQPSPHFLRLRQIIGDASAAPPIAPIIPIGKSAWWEGIRAGRYPKGIKLSPRVTVWRASDIYALVQK
jgi:prophage regulatory protein